MPRRLIALKTFTAADLASVDPQTAELKDDFTVIMTAGMSKSGDIFFFERFRQRGGEAIAILTEIFRQMLIYESFQGFVEKNRWESLMATGRKLVDNGVLTEELNSQGFKVTLSETKRLLNKVYQLPHYTNKKERIRVGIQGYLRSHSLWFPSNWPETREQILLHPAVENDDDLDVIEMLCSNMTAPTIDVLDATRTGDRLGQRNASKYSINELLATRKYNSLTGTYSGISHAKVKTRQSKQSKDYLYGS